METANNWPLKDKVALITGGAVRLGRAIAQTLAEQGCKVIIHYGQSDSAARTFQQKLEQAGHSCAIIQQDLSQPSCAEKLIQDARQAFGCIDILINNAAIFPENDRFANLNNSDWQKIMTINLQSPIFLSQVFSQQPELKEAAIINILDARLNQAQVDHFNYRLAKSALRTATEMMALELAPKIRVNAVAPGAILPPPGASIDALITAKTGKIPLNKLGHEKLIAENVRHLLEQSFLTGVVLSVDGGEFL